jgi:hypothetical protein
VKKTFGFVLVFLLAVGLLYAQDYAFNVLYVNTSIINQTSELDINQTGGGTSSRLLLNGANVELLAHDGTTGQQILLLPVHRVGQFPRLAFNDFSVPALDTGDFALSAGWGTTASVLGVEGADNNFAVIVLSTGTGQAANPTVTFTYKAGDFNTFTANMPIFTCTQTLTTGALAFVTVTRGETSMVMTWNATPVDGDAYEISCIGIQRN